jgi:hypothetical protein
MQKSFNIFAAVTVTALALSLAGQPAKASVINWGSATTISGTSDVDTTGTLFASANFGSSSGETVNGVFFNAFPVSGTSTTVGNITLTSSGGLSGFTYSPPATTTAPYGSLPIEYKNILSPFAYTDTLPQQATVSGLTIGETYAIQFWVQDPRAAFGARTVTVGTQTLDVNTTDTEGGLGQWVLGQFTADATTQSFSVGPGPGGPTPATYANAMQVRLVPEPTQMVSVAAIGSALGMWRMRKLRRNGCDSDATAC